MEYISEIQIHEEIRQKKKDGVCNTELMRKYHLSYAQLRSILDEGKEEE